MILEFLIFASIQKHNSCILRCSIIWELNAFVFILKINFIQYFARNHE